MYNRKERVQAVVDNFDVAIDLIGDLVVKIHIVDCANSRPYELVIAEPQTFIKEANRLYRKI